MSGEACACLRVHYDRIEMRGGSLCRERWLCVDCGSEFVKRAMATYRLAELEAENARLASQRTCPEHTGELARLRSAAEKAIDGLREIAGMFPTSRDVDMVRAVATSLDEALGEP